MKRILSIVLAAALIVSLVPAVFAAEAEGTISYEIKQTSVKTTALDGEILAPVETTEGANFGKIKFTNNDYLDKTILNVLKNSEGAYAKADGSISNSEIGVVTYRELEYHGYVKSDASVALVKKPATSYKNYIGKDNATTGLKVVDGTTEIKTYKISETIDLSKTAPFEIIGKFANISHSFLYDGGFRGSFNYGTKATPDLPANLNKYAFALRLKVPENATTGNYTVKLTNELANPDKESIYTDTYAAATEVYITKIDPAVGVEGKWAYNSGLFSVFTDANGNTLDAKYYADEENKLTGLWISANGASKEFPDVLRFEAGAEYIVYFRIDPDTATKITNGTYKSCLYSGKYYQNFHISSVKLIPAGDVEATLKNAELSYDNYSRKISATGKLNDGTAADLKDATIAYTIESANGATISDAGVITPGSADETVSVYADVTLGGKTVRTDAISVKVFKPLGTDINYRLSTDFINNTVFDTIVDADADPNHDIRNSELLLISWKDIYYKKTGPASNGTYVINKTTAGNTDFAPIVNALTTDTSKYELPGRIPGDLVPKFTASGYITQLLLQKFSGEELTTSNLAANSKSRPHFALKIYVPRAGAYKLTLANNFTLADVSTYGGNSYVKNGVSLGREAVSEVYFAKADFDLTNNSSGSGYIPTDKEATVFTAENKIGWYNSGLYGQTQSYDKALVVPEAGEYYLVFNMSEESLVKNPNVHHRAYDNDVYQDFQVFSLSGAELTPVANDPEYEESFDAEVEDYTTSGKAIVDAYTFAGEEAILSANNEVALGNTFNVTAPEIDGYNFLYWAKGTSESKLVVSYENELTFKPSEGRNSLIAVYAEESAEVNRAEFYNANGTLIKTLTADGKAPEYPSMAGYGDADGWQLYGSETIYGAGEDIAVSGNMIFVAKYPETPATVIVNGTEYTYGDTVTMPELDSTKIFKGWKRNNEIVSTDPNYTFKAYENATVEAVYAENTPVFSGKFMKIVIDSFSAGDKTAVMAEFIGIENAVEKGIMIGDTKKIAMKGNGNQFSILADVPNATYVGYAILKNGTTFTQVIDGAYSK